MFAIKVLNVKNTSYEYVFISHKQENILRGVIAIPCVAFNCVGDAIVFRTLEDARDECEAITKYLLRGLKLRIEEWEKPEGDQPAKFIKVVENYNEHKVEES